MVRLKMAENIKVASQYVQQVIGVRSVWNVLTKQGHVRVGPTLVTDPAFLVSRTLEDFITWTNTSKIRKHIANYESTRDDYDLME
jgi:U3 small nucleolar ribonucleoprotein protein IMP3